MNPVPTLLPARPDLVRLAKQYGISGVFINPALAGSRTEARLLTWSDRTRRIELSPGHDFLRNIFLTLHECGHAVRGDQQADEREFRLFKFAVNLYHDWREAGKPVIPVLQEWYETEEKIVNSWAWDQFLHHYGPRYAREEDFERQGFAFQHRI